jgi:hypothetical protein
MTTFIELVIAPAILPWLIVLITDYVETRLDREEEARARRDIERSAMGGHSV